MIIASSHFAGTSLCRRNSLKRAANFSRTSLPAASIWLMVTLSGPGALPFFDCLTASLTSQVSTSGKPSNRCSSFVSLSKGGGASDLVYVLLMGSCKVQQSERLSEEGRE